MSALAIPMAPTTDCELPVRTSAPSATYALAALAMSETSLKEPVNDTWTVALGSWASTPALKPSTYSWASPTLMGPMTPITWLLLSMPAM